MKSRSRLVKWVKLGKISHIWEIGHTVKNGAKSGQWVTFENMYHIVMYKIDFKK